MKINISNNTDNEINISGLDCVVLIPINTFENIREIIDIFMTTYGQNETKIIGYIKNHTHFIGFKFEQNVIIRINLLQKLLKNDNNFILEESVNENCLLFKISRK